MIKNKQQRFVVFLPIVIFSVFALMAIGGIVRGTGTGVGCPNWPTCFGQYILPSKITWIEYANRLVGLWTGLAFVVLSYLSLGYRKSGHRVFWATQLSMLLGVYNCWLSVKVLGANLDSGLATVHVLLAIILILVLQRISLQVEKPDISNLDISISKLKKYKKISLILLFMILVQVVLGTQVREQIDQITSNEPNLAKGNWLGRLDEIFDIHRSYSIFLILGLVYLLRKLVEELKGSVVIQELCINIAMLLIAEVVAGTVLAYSSFPAAIQPVHLLLSLLLVSSVFKLFLILDIFSKKIKS